jgi:hypothetical protein
MNNLTQRRQGAKTRKEQLLCFLCAFCGFATLRETLLFVQGLFHSIASRGKIATPPEPRQGRKKSRPKVTAQWHVS